MNEEILPKNKMMAAQLIASGQMEKQQIADVVGVNRSTLWLWEKDEKMKTEIDRFKREMKDFGEGMIKGKLVEAIKGYWDLIQTTSNDKVKADGYEFFIERSIGKLSTRVEVEASMNQTNTIDDDVLEAELLEFEEGEG